MDLQEQTNRIKQMMGIINEDDSHIHKHIEKTNPHKGDRDAFMGIPSLKNYTWDDNPVLIYPDDEKINKNMLWAASYKDVKKYKKMYEKGYDFPPIVIVDNGKEYLILDGAHRLKAALKLNVPIKAYIGK
jgi:hypothetical protein